MGVSRLPAEHYYCMIYFLMALPFNAPFIREACVRHGVEGTSCSDCLLSAERPLIPTPLAQSVRLTLMLWHSIVSRERMRLPGLLLLLS